MQIKGTLLGCGRTFAGSHPRFRNSPNPKWCGCLRRLSQQPQGLLWRLSQPRDSNGVFQRLPNGRWKACEGMLGGGKKKARYAISDAASPVGSMSQRVNITSG